MHLRLFNVGKLSLKTLAPLIEAYTGRIAHYLPIQIETFKSSEEGLKQLKPADFLVVLDERGKSFTSVGFAKWMEEKKLHAAKSLVFMVGPGEGFSEAIKKRANLLLRLSDMTLQHELAQVVLLEQLYRACTILKGEPYHK